MTEPVTTKELAEALRGLAACVLPTDLPPGKAANIEFLLSRWDTQQEQQAKLPRTVPVQVPLVCHKGCFHFALGNGFRAFKASPDVYVHAHVPLLEVPVVEASKVSSD